MNDTSIEEIKEFFELNKKTFKNDIKSKTIHLDCLILLEYSPTLLDMLLENPSTTIKLFESVLTDIIWAGKFTIRITNLPKTNCIPIREIRSKHLNKLISVEGVIRQTSEVRPKVVKIKYECASCGSIITLCPLNSQEKPKRCSCGNKSNFKEISKDLIDSQSISIEEPYDILEHSTQPKKLTIILDGDLTEPKMEDKTTPGNTITVIGILKEVERIKNGTKSLIYEICVEANQIIPMQDDFANIEVSEEDELKIKEIAKDNPLDKLINNYAPSIYGNDSIKRALVLQLFGGNRITRTDGTMRRGEINVLIVGDGGTSKSMLLKYTGTLAPKSRYVSGMSTSGVGITASVVRDEITGDWSLQAGAMVLAHNGVILLDELDKMNAEDRSNLHEAMSIGSITISKATVQASLQCRTAVLAAANPKMGRFNNNQSIVRQINLVPTLLSRFDCIFVLRDLPNQNKDEKIADRILSEEISQDVIISSNLIRKYVAYAKKNIKPKITREAVENIKKFYVRLRNTRQSDSDAIPMGARQLETLIRLSEASAKIRLSNSIKKEDTKIAINVMMDYLHGVGFDNETGKFDIDMIHGVGSSERKRIEYLLTCIENVMKENEGYASLDNITKLVDNKLTEKQIENGLYSLSKQGDIIKTTAGYKKI